mmetsp:Transcript_23269/g.34155  ORF Transcript_23269/g.34155 Transcript_23269/m.34155 type:complete len:1343 (-) Transcript_23269:210-4238(-)
MHIKQVVISGFRSFRNQGEIEPFSPKHNVIVGRNGSGKSNFFNAIQFVLVAPRFATLRQEDRQHLLHEGAGSSVMAAYVEIVFDNADGRLSVDSDEVILRRTIGHKKDEFFLNRKRIQKSEVISLLESAGFSKSNPYYIVQQGKVANLCLMKDSDRLNLLKEIAGTTVYEERRAESLKILADTTNKQDRIVEVLSFIEERLDELEKEKEELTKYDYLDKRRRALQFMLYDKELSKVTAQLESIESSWSSQMTDHQELFSRLRSLQDEAGEVDDALSGAQQGLDRLLTRRVDKVEECRTAVEKRSKLQVELQEAQASENARNSALEECHIKLREVQSSISEREEELANLEPQYTAKRSQLENLQLDLTESQARMETLYGKQGRGKQFSSEEDRNRFLQNQIDSLKELIKNKNSLRTRLQQEIRQAEMALKAESKELKTTEKDNRNKVAKLGELERSAKEVMRARNGYQETRKEAWRLLESVQEELQERRSELDKGKHMLNSALPRNVSLGLAMVERIAQEKKLGRAYMGPLIDNLVLRNEAFRTAVEVAAGNSLFHVIVDTDATAAMLMKELERRKAGRLTFLPLNQLRVHPVFYPESGDVRPLIEVALEFDTAVAPAIRQVFGKKLLAKDLDAAAKYSRESQLDAVTMEGDVVSRKGGFEGGYQDDRASKILSVLKIRAATTALSVLQSKEEDARKRAEAADELVTGALRDLQSIEAEQCHLRSNTSQASKEIASRVRQQEIAAVSLERRKAALRALEGEITTARRQVEEYVAEIQSDLNVPLTTVERGELHALSERVQTLHSEIGSVEAEVLVLSNTRERLRADLRDNLHKRRGEIYASLASLGDEKDAGDIERGGGKRVQTRGSTQIGVGGGEEAVVRAELERAEIVVRELEAELEATDDKILHKKQEVSALEQELDGLRKEEQQAQEQMAQAAKVQDRLLNKRTMLSESSLHKQRQIRELGSLPRKELEELEGMTDKNLLAFLKEVNEKLKTFSGVNRKALDQYVSFNEQRKTLLDRRDSLRNDKISILQLIDNLDLQKEEAILRTFQGVSGHFADVFKELVPEGQGRLVMVTAADMVEAGNDGQTGELEEKNEVSLTTATLDEDQLSISSFLGVQVKVCFSESGQQFEMQQLSGGQKALVAIAIIFAIQRCDPAPFYLFDEIDQALDANHRNGIARLIQKQASSPESPAQFITTTFRQELVGVANKYYGIALQNKNSRIYALDKRDALTFVTNLMSEEEAVGRTLVSDVANFSTKERTRVRAASPLSPFHEGVEEGKVSSNLQGDGLESDEESLDYGSDADSRTVRASFIDEDMKAYADEGVGIMPAPTRKRSRKTRR